VKTHLNAIYRKAGVQGRGQLVSVLIEDLLNAPLVPEAAAATKV
jgi:DNA-binding NarL/FixJ family response regulator